MIVHGDVFPSVGVSLLLLTPGAYLLAPVARRLAPLVLVVGVGGLSKGQGWASATIAFAVWVWLVGHWSYLIRHNGLYRSRLARAVFDRTPLRVTLPGYWVLRRRRRDAQAVENERERRRRGEVIDRSLEARVPRLR